MDRDTLVEEMRRVAREEGTDRLSLALFARRTGIPREVPYRLFRSWTAAVETAGLTPHGRMFSDDEALRELRETFMRAGRVCNARQVRRYGRVGSGTYCKRFGGWPGAKKALRRWLVATGTPFPYMNQLPRIRREDLPALEAREEAALPPSEKERRRRLPAYGAVLNFRAMLHAPVNEQGVVLLFGMVCEELGFLIEAVRTAYPDCEAKRRLHGQREEWQRVRIEFEFRSSGFREDAHDPAGCDLIVCWKHDWLECPVEVLELRSEVGGFDPKERGKGRAERTRNREGGEGREEPLEGAGR